MSGYINEQTACEAGSRALKARVYELMVIMNDMSFLLSKKAALERRNYETFYEKNKHRCKKE